MYVYNPPPYKVSHLVTTIKPKVRYRFHVATMLLHYSPKTISITKVAYFSQIYQHTKFEDSIISVTSVTLLRSLPTHHGGIIRKLESTKEV
jgi:hypothetical protein